MEFSIKRIGRIVVFSGLVALGSREVYAAVPTIISSATVRVVRVQYSTVAVCQGVDNTIVPVAIMAPVSGTNDVRVTIAPPTQATRVQFTTANSAIATVSPAAATTTPETLHIGGVARGTTQIRARTSTSGVLRALTADAKPRINKTIAIHAITEQNDDVQAIPVGQGEPNQTCVTAGASGLLTTPGGDDVLVGTTSIHTGSNGICDSFAAPSDVQVIPVGQGRPNRPCVTQGANSFRDTIPVGDDQIAGADINSGANGVCQTAANATNLVPTHVPAAAALQTYLNTIWGQQANIMFTVTRTDLPVNYDLDRSGVLADPSLVSATLAEINAIAAGAKTAGVDYNIYFINVMEVPQAFTIQTPAGIPAALFNSTWIQSTHANSEENVSAHEVGHLLGINYESPDVHDVMLNFGSSTNPCEVRKNDWDTVNHP